MDRHAISPLHLSQLHDEVHEFADLALASVGRWPSEDEATTLGIAEKVAQLLRKGAAAGENKALECGYQVRSELVAPPVIFHAFWRSPTLYNLRVTPRADGAAILPLWRPTAVHCRRRLSHTSAPAS